ncbi:MAG: hypothetical protein ABSC22_15435 [Roseiarcus sp.]|jgi:hypothetical protein
MGTSLKPRTFRLRAGGVECDAGGLRVGGAQLLESVVASPAVRRWRPLAQSEIDRILSRAYGAEIRASDKRGGLTVAAEALNKGELARAQIAALLLRLPDPALSKLDPGARNEQLACLRESGLLAKDWSEDDHPRTGTPPNPGWFAPKDDSGAAGTEGGHQSGSAERGRGQELAFAGVLIDKRYDEVANITHCTYRTPLRDFTIEFPYFEHCPPTFAYPFSN